MITHEVEVYQRANGDSLASILVLTLGFTSEVEAAAEYQRAKEIAEEMADNRRNHPPPFTVEFTDAVGRHTLTKRDIVGASYIGEAIARREWIAQRNPNSKPPEKSE